MIELRLVGGPYAGRVAIIRAGQMWLDIMSESRPGLRLARYQVHEESGQALFCGKVRR